MGERLKLKLVTRNERNSQLAHIFRNTSTALLMLGCWAATPAVGQQVDATSNPHSWHLVSEEGNAPVCADLKRHMMRLDEVNPNACDIQFDQSEKGLHSPIWQTLDYSSHLAEIEYAYVNFQSRPNTFTADYIIRQHPDLKDQAGTIFWQDYKKAIVAEFAAGRSKIERAEIDMDGDGKPETIYRINLRQPMVSQPEKFSSLDCGTKELHFVFSMPQSDTDWTARYFATMGYEADVLVRADAGYIYTGIGHSAYLNRINGDTAHAFCSFSYVQ